MFKFCGSCPDSSLGISRSNVVNVVNNVDDDVVNVNVDDDDDDDDDDDVVSGDKHTNEPIEPLCSN